VRISENQLRSIIREALTGEPYVVIGNHGRGSQALYPSSEAPVAYDQAEAEDLVRRLNAGESGPFRTTWHTKPLTTAGDFISPGQPSALGLLRLQGSTAP
jgi:hypothetical protein